MGRLVRILGVGFALGILAATVVSAWGDLASESVSFDPIRAALAVLLLAAIYLGTVEAWRALMRLLGITLDYRDVIRLWSYSNLGRYLPGKVWTVVGVVVLAGDLGVPPGVATAHAFLGVGFMIGTGALVGLLLVPESVTSFGLAGMLIPVVALSSILPILLPGLLPAALRSLPRSFGCARIPTPRRRAVAVQVGRFALIWLLQGAGFLLLASSMGEVSLADFPRFAGAFALAYVVGLLAVFAPGGIGVREAVLGMLLGSFGGGDLPVHLLAVASRLWAIAAELLILLLAFTLGGPKGGTRA
ncbi:MAG: hypothetical protein CME07_05095 [Gemmatimonadetes bacterium]|jgi:hypothetical protein|nr:hypothetical protein [Gemmatimonadota bacterium]